MQPALTLLINSLDESRNAVRSYDTKAQIVGVGYIFAMGIITQVSRALQTNPEIGVSYVVVAWAVVILPIILFGIVLYPTRRTLIRRYPEDPIDLANLLYVDPDRYRTTEELTATLSELDIEREVSFELIKMSRLREIKRARFVRALMAAGLSFLVLFSFQVLSTLGLIGQA